ncbi:MAG: c-type cytochrome [Ghiorsea sp.]|nr:c-type cytochrome [Ghiorsea sp.]
MLKKTVLAMGCVALLSSTAIASEMHGKALYEQNCASCHGADGKVSQMGMKLKPFPARDLTALAEVVDRDELRRIIAYGIRGTAMVPKRYDLDAAGIEDVIDYVFTFKRKINMANGKKRFEQVCATCHGFDGRAKTGMGAKNLVYSNLNLKDTVHTMRYGRIGTKMTSKRHQLTNPDIEDVAYYVHELRFKADTKKGAVLFSSTCKSCHSSPSAIKLGGNRARTMKLTDMSDYLLDLRIRHGRHVDRAGKKVAKLSEDETQDIIAYLRKETK